MKQKNPFVLSVYACPQYFCNREKETDIIVNAIYSQRNLTLISHRRLGKSGLIRHVFHKLRSEKDLKTFYIDIMDTEDLNGFVNLLAREIIGKVDGRTMQLIKMFTEVVKSLRPKIAVDPMTGKPEIEFSLQNDASPETSLAEIFSYLQKQKKQLVIAFDEFQQIAEYPEKNVEALLRKHIQQINNTSFIFSGSQKHLLLSIFSDYKRAFYQSAQLLNLEKIEEDAYKEFIHLKFKKGKKKIGHEALEFIMKYTRRHTFYVQFLCNRLYNLPTDIITVETVTNTLLNILDENEIIYLNYKKLLTAFQFKLLEAFAKAQGVSRPTSKGFIEKFHLGTPSSVKTALSALLKKEMVFQDEKKYRVYDIFFAKWLERRGRA